MFAERRRALEDWLEFVRGDTHILRRRPASVLQQAANSPDSIAPAQAARQYVADHPSRPLILRTNKPLGRGACLLTITAHTKGVYACALSPDGTRVATASSDATLKIWDVASGLELLTLTGHTETVYDCVFLADGRHLVSAAADRTLIIWNASDGRPLRTLSGHAAAVRCCAPSPDGRLIVSGAADGGLRLWDAETGTELANLTHSRDAATGREPGPQAIERCAFSPDGRLVAACAGTTLHLFEIASRRQRNALTWQTRAPTQVSESPEGAECCAFSPDGTQVVCGSGKGKRVSFGRVVSEGYGELRIWEVASGKHLRTITAHGDVATSVAWSPDGRWIASGGKDGTLKLWNADGFEANRLAAHTARVTSCTFSADGRLLASSSWDGSIKIWMPRRAVDAGPPAAEHIGVVTCRFSPGGERLLSGAKDGTVAIWNSESGASERLLRGYPDAISTIAVSPDSSTAAIGSGRIGANAEAQLRVWDVRSGKELYLDDWDEGGSVGTCAFTPDGRRVISGWVGWKNVELKLLSTGPPPVLLSFGKHANLFLRFVVMGGGRVLVTTAGTVLEAIDLDTGRVIATAKGHGRLAAFPNGRSVLCGSAGGTLAQWPLAGEPRVWAAPHEHLGEWAISPDGTRLVTASTRAAPHLQPPGEIALWDLPTQRRLAAARADSIVERCAFSADGLHVVGCTSDGTLTIWDNISLSEVATYVPGGRHQAFDIAAERLAVADSFGAIHLLRASGLPRGPAVVTAEYLYDFDAHAWSETPSFLCAWCGTRLEVSPRLRTALAGRLATTDPLDDCSACRRPVRFNPLIVDWRDLAPPAPAETAKDRQRESPAGS